MSNEFPVTGYFTNADALFTAELCVDSQQKYFVPILAVNLFPFEIVLKGLKAVCEKTGMTYEALKFYCNQGLVPNVKRDSGNRRVFDERDIAWIESLSCLKRCGLSIQEMRHYVQLCLQGKDSIPERKVILAQKRQVLLEQIAQLQGAVDYVDQKQAFYDDVLAGRRPYVSNLLPRE